MITRRIPFYFCLLIAVAACTSKPQQPSPSGQTTKVERSEAANPNDVNGAKGFDLGGPCLEPPQPGLLAGRQEEELLRSGDVKALVEGAKRDVRNACGLAHRWEKLFHVLLKARQYDEAVQVADEMQTRGFPLPQALLSRSDPAFLSSSVFMKSSIGAQYAVREQEYPAAMRTAQERLARMTSPERPPTVYQSKGACPFECCTYRQWITTNGIQLLDAIGSSNVLAKIPAGTSIRAITGEVHVEPEPYAVLQDLGALKAGDVIFFLDNLGEGFVNYWNNGKVKPDIGLDEGLIRYVDQDCVATNLKGACSLRKLQPEKEFSAQWWVRLKTRDGKEGWVLNTGRFKNMDACG